MPVYVDPLMQHGWKMRGHYVPSCHLLTDDPTLAELHAIADLIEMKREWLHWPWGSAPHYDLIPSKREAAIAAGAWELHVRTNPVHTQTFRQVMAQWCAVKPPGQCEACRGKGWPTARVCCEVCHGTGKTPIQAPLGYRVSR